MKILMQNLSEVTDFIPDRIQILLTPYSASQAKVAIVYGDLCQILIKFWARIKMRDGQGKLQRIC